MRRDDRSLAVDWAPASKAAIYGDERLQEWSRWVRGPRCPNGWPATSVAFRLALGKELGIAVDRGTPAELPDSVVATDGVVAQLKQEERLLYRVVRFFYLNNDAIKVKLEKLHGMPRSTYYRLADRAKAWVGARLSDNGL